MKTASAVRMKDLRIGFGKLLTGLFGAVLLSAALAPAAAEAHEPFIFICLKCHRKISKDSRPRVNNCGAGGNHQWHQLCKVGPMIHTCLKCRMVVNSHGRPNVSYCRAGGNHQWHFLGHRGHDNYICRKCKLKLRTSGRPNVSYCPAGGNHLWDKY